MVEHHEEKHSSLQVDGHNESLLKEVGTVHHTVVIEKTIEHHDGHGHHETVVVKKHLSLDIDKIHEPVEEHHREVHVEVAHKVPAEYHHQRTHSHESQKSNRSSRSHRSNTLEEVRKNKKNHSTPIDKHHLLHIDE